MFDVILNTIILFVLGFGLLNIMFLPCTVFNIFFFKTDKEELASKYTHKELYIFWLKVLVIQIILGFCVLFYYFINV